MVYGQPRSKGSARAFTVPGKDAKPARAIIVQQNDRGLRDWERLIRDAAQPHAKAGVFWPQGVPVAVDLVFAFTRPKSKKKGAAVTVKPDFDKITRTVCDALQGVLFTDDCQITTGQIRKRYIEGPSRVVIRLRFDDHALDDSGVSA